jgi:hypothetical protein
MLGADLLALLTEGLRLVVQLEENNLFYYYF